MLRGSWGVKGQILLLIILTHGTFQYILISRNWNCRVETLILHFMFLWRIDFIRWSLTAIMGSTFQCFCSRLLMSLPCWMYTSVDANYIQFQSANKTGRRFLPRTRVLGCSVYLQILRWQNPRRPRHSAVIRLISACRSTVAPKAVKK